MKYFKPIRYRNISYSLHEFRYHLLSFTFHMIDEISIDDFLKISTILQYSVIIRPSRFAILWWKGKPETFAKIVNSVRNMCRYKIIYEIHFNKGVVVFSGDFDLFYTYLSTIATDLIFLHFPSNSLECTTCSHANSSFFFALVDVFEVFDIITNLHCCVHRY